jgi:hypothetical protein
MLTFRGIQRVFLARLPQDMRRGIDTLSSVVAQDLGQDPYAGDCFVFLVVVVKPIHPVNHRH